jgi:hypothetical protein
MSLMVKFNTALLERAMADYKRMKKKTDASVVNKAMRFWLPFASEKVKRRSTTPAQVRIELTGQAKRISRGGKKKRHQLTNTVAAEIIASRIRKKQGIKYFPKASSGPNSAAFVSDFYDAVQSLVNARVRSVGFLAAGFIPAYKAFNVPRIGMPRNQKRFKGRSIGTKAVPASNGKVHAFASVQRLGAYIIAPKAFSSSIPEVRRQFINWMAQDVNEVAKKTGFKK